MKRAILPAFSSYMSHNRLVMISLIKLTLLAEVREWGAAAI